MAGDWLKIEHATPEKPEVLAIASGLGCSPDEAFGICFRMWRWFDQHTIDGNAAGVTSALLDRCLGATGFTDLALRVGWLIEDNGGISQPNFGYHTGSTAKQRALTAKRVKSCREKKAVTEVKRDCNATSVTPSSLLYISLMSSSSIPEELQEEDFARAWDKWVAHRKEIKKPLKKTMVEGQLKMLAEKGREAAIRMIDHTVAMGWQGLRDPEPAKKQATGNGSVPPEDDFEEFVKRNLKGAKHDR